MNVKIQSFVLGRKVFSADNWIRNGGEKVLKVCPSILWSLDRRYKGRAGNKINRLLTSRQTDRSKYNYKK